MDVVVLKQINSPVNDLSGFAFKLGFTSRYAYNYAVFLSPLNARYLCHLFPSQPHTFTHMDHILIHFLLCLTYSVRGRVPAMP